MELFISYANSWRSIEVPLKSKEKIQSDPHSPAIYRVIGVLQNMPDFYRIFNIPENKKIIKIFN
jgi:putative endopeptidase